MEEREPKAVAKALSWSSVGKRAIAGVLMVLMFLVVGFVTVEILYNVVRVLLPEDALPALEIVLSEEQMMSLLGLFLSVLIGLELIETVEVYFRDHSVHVEIVVLVAIIALARKVILLDLSTYTSLTLAALAFLLLALGVVYFLVRRAAPADE